MWSSRGLVAIPYDASVTTPPRRLTLALLLLGAGLAAGRDAPAPEAPDAAPVVARRLAAAAKARAAGDRAEVRHHLLRALAIAPADGDVLSALIALDGPDGESGALWMLHAALAGADDGGRFTPPRDWPRSLAADAAFAQAAARGHAKALDAIRVAVARQKGATGHGTLLWLRGLARELSAGSPSGASALAGGLEARFLAAEARTAPDTDSVVRALLGVVTTARGRGDLDTALEAARTVRGLAQQAGQSKTAGAVPGGAAQRAARAIAEMRRELREREDAAAAAAAQDADGAAPERPVWDVPSLEQVEAAEIDAWNVRHGRWSAPGVALSLQARYRVETVCGLVTLLTVTSDIELHHARLVRWFGGDPFERRQGLVRLCPDYRDFEGEGQPFWWAGGFQAGDVTTMIARFPTRGGLGGTLVHELNHRFDGALYPGLPAWLSEGRAVYVQSGSLRPDAADVNEDVTAWMRLWEANAKGYTRPDGLRDLLRGEIADYRHNYDAGYALFAFLRRFADFAPAQDGTPLFRPRITAYLRSFRAKPRTEPVARFESFFCDGEDGRPADLGAFAALFGRYAAEGGSGATPAAPWKQTMLDRARRARIEANRGRLVARPIFDRPTFQPGRSRSDPPDHGQYHAVAAARILLAEGRKRAALEAVHWALRADEADAAELSSAAEQNAAAGHADVAWTLRLLAHHVDPVLHTPPPGAPGGTAAAPWRAAAAVAASYGEAAQAAAVAGRPRLARALRAEHDRLAAWLGLPLLGEGPGRDGAADGAADGGMDGGTDGDGEREPHAPELRPYVSLLRGGVVETRWAPLYSEPGPWYRPTVDAVELGRRREGAESSNAVRDARRRRVFVESAAWMQGAYTVRTRVRFLSAFAGGELVVGKTHRDRGLRISFGGGDWNYAVGNRDSGTPLSEIAIGVSDLRPWGRRVAALRKTVVFPSPRDVFELEVRVAGPYVTVLVDGAVQLSHRRPTGTPIEGRVGFGLSRGLVRFEEPAVRRHRTLGAEAAVPGARLDEALDPRRHGTFPWATVAGRRVAGLPLSPRGTLLLWYPDGTPESLLEPPAVGAAVETYLRWLGDLRREIAVYVAVPGAVAADDELVRDPATAHESIAAVLRHAGHADVRETLRAANHQPDGSVIYRGYPEVPLWLMIDDRGVVRSAAPLDPMGPAIDLVRALAGR